MFGGIANPEKEARLYVLYILRGQCLDSSLEYGLEYGFVYGVMVSSEIVP